MEHKRPAKVPLRVDAGLDELDLKILALLLTDGRLSFRQMAHEFHTSTSTVSSRVARLEKAGTVRGYTAKVNFEALGYDLTAVTEIVVSKGKLAQTEAEIAKLPGVCAVYDVTGEKDGIIVAKFRKRAELSGFAKGLLSMPHVEHADTHVVLATVKEDFHVPLWLASTD